MLWRYLQYGQDRTYSEKGDFKLMDPSPPSPSSLLKIRLVSLWFTLQVFLNIAVALYLALHPPDEPVSWFERLDFTVNTGVNAALAVGFWQRRSWAWSAAVVLVPLYWVLHAWHMLVPAEGVLLWPFLLVDAGILAWLHGPRGREGLGAPVTRFRPAALAPPVMGAVALYAATAPLLGLFVAAPVALAVAGVGLRRALKAEVRHGDAETRRRGENVIRKH